MKKKKVVGPRKSLRTILMLWFLLFSVAPLAFITGYSLVKYEQSIDQELGQRLVGNSREITATLGDFENVLSNDGRSLAADKQLVYYISSNNFSQARELMKGWLKGHYAHHLWLWSADGRLEVALYRDSEGEVQRLDKMEGGDVFLSDLKTIQAQDQVLDIDIRPPPAGSHTNTTGVVELMVFSQIRTQAGRTVGFVQQVINMDEHFLLALKNRLGAELFFYRPNQEKIVATHPDLAAYKTTFFSPQLGDGKFFELNIREQPFRFMLKELSWGTTNVVLGIGASKGTARAVLKNVNYAFFTVVGAIVLLLVVLSMVTSRILLRPIYSVLDAIRNLDLSQEPQPLPGDNETELGLLTESFNDMTMRTYKAQSELRENIRELEGANIEIRETQAKLVHAAKMASLGQLVAGVAHELNNPIGFIYSNMGVLREYGQKLIHLVKIAQSAPKQLDAEIKAADLEYIIQDLPRLISSCEDGARRTRDIVVGLRNFSRLDEAQLKEVNLHEGIESTLQLLTSELKNRIRIVREFGDLPKVSCYASQINQVFMNILSNAAHAIEGEGEIKITTRRQGGDRVAIIIKDSGQGMDRQTLEKIFDPFFTTKTQGSGTGLGLSISYGVIQKHGGEILVQSEIGKGTEFTVILPIKSS